MHPIWRQGDSRRRQQLYLHTITCVRLWRTCFCICDFLFHSIWDNAYHLHRALLDFCRVAYMLKNLLRFNMRTEYPCTRRCRAVCVHVCVCAIGRVKYLVSVDFRSMLFQMCDFCFPPLPSSLHAVALSLSVTLCILLNLSLHSIALKFYGIFDIDVLTLYACVCVCVCIRVPVCVARRSTPPLNRYSSVHAASCLCSA